MVDTNYNLIPKSFYTTSTDGQTKTLTVDKSIADAVQVGIQAKLDNLPPIQRDALLAMTANLAPGDVDTPQELNGVLAVFEAAAKQATSATSAAFVGDIAKFMAKVM